MISFKNFGLSLKYLIFLLLSISYISCAPVSVHLNQKLCSFKAGDYSLQWAYEPQSKNVVFVLKQKSELNNFWTGVGFGDRKKGIIDFIGVFVKNGQIGIADTHIIPDDGTLTPDSSTNVQSIAFDYHNKSVTAKFARALKSPDDKFDQDLDNCQTFNFAINGGSISRSGIVPDFDEIAEKRICDIDKNCIVDIRQHLKPSESPSPEATSKSDAKLFSDPKNIDNDSEDGLASMVMYWVLYSPSLDLSSGTKKITKPEFAESVDISGTGDPCSFAGVGYTVNWTYSPETGMVDFSMKHPIRMGKWWSAVGIGDTMADMDIAIMFISSGRPKRIRDYFSKSYTVPEEDEKQDWVLSRHRTKSVDEMIELGFSRKLETDDSDKDRTLDGCVLFQFAANAGHYGSGFAVRKHEEWPDLYKACDIKKHCIKKETESNESKEGGEEEISESNDDDVIDEADDESGEVVLVKKRTKAKQESRRQLDSSQIENEDGTSTTNVVIQLPGATFSTSVPSENAEGTTEAGSAEGVTAASNESGEQAVTTPSSIEAADAQGKSESGEKVEEQGPTTASFEVGQNLRTAAEDAEASAGPTTLSGETNQDLRTASEGNELNQGPTTISGETAEGLQANTVTEIPNAIAENNSSSSEGASNEGETTTLSPEATTASATTIETTTFAANVTQMPVHIMPIVGGELNSTMLIPGMDDPDFGESSLGGVIEVNRTLDGNETLAQGNDTDAATPTTTTLEPGFGIQSTFADRPTTISSGESGISNADVTGAPRRAGEENTEVENSVTDATSTSEGFGESTGLRNILPVTLPLNNNFKPTVSTKLVSLEELESDKETTTEDGLSVGKNQIETVTVPSEITNNVAEAGKELTDLANSLNNTEIEVEVTTAASETGETNVGNGRGNVGEGKITTPGDVEILPETNDAEGTTLEVESALNNGLDTATTVSSDSTSGEEATTISSGDGKKGNNGKNNGKGKSDEILKDPTSAPNKSETDDVKVSSDVTTASGEDNSEAMTAATDDSDLTATSDAAVTTNENNASSIAGESTTPSSETTESSESQGTTRIDSDANGSTVAIGTLPEISSTDETKTTLPGVTPLKVVIGGDSNEAGDTTENLLEILSTTVTRAGNGLRDSAVTDSLSSLAATNKVTSPTSLEATTQAASSGESSETTSEIEGSGEASSPTSSPDAAAATTPIPGPFDHHKQQLIDELGKEAVGNPKEGCGEGHEDYSQCTTYFKNYLARVQIWADENHERMEDQYGKACTLLSAVQNVTTLCCSIFVETCKGKIEF